MGQNLFPTQKMPANYDSQLTSAQLEGQAQGNKLIWQQVVCVFLCLCDFEALRVTASL